MPELDYVTQRGRGWAKVVSDTGSSRPASAAIDIDHEPGFRQVIQVQEGIAR